MLLVSGWPKDSPHWLRVVDSTWRRLAAKTVAGGSAGKRATIWCRSDIGFGLLESTEAPLNWKSRTRNWNLRRPSRRMFPLDVARLQLALRLRDRPYRSGLGDVSRSQSHR